MKVVATTRSAQGTGASRRLRRAGKVPGIVYGGTAGIDQPLNIEIEHNALFHALRKEVFHSSILDLEVDGKAGASVLLRDVQMHPFKQQVLHIDFQRVAADRVIHVKVPLHFVNVETSPAVKLHANIVSHVMNDIEVVCLPKDLPEFLEIDLANLEPQGTVHVSDLKLPEGVTVTPQPEEVVATASVPAAMVEEKTAADTAAAEAAAATPAAGAAADKGGDKAEKSEKK